MTSSILWEGQVAPCLWPHFHTYEDMLTPASGVCAGVPLHHNETLANISTTCCHITLLLHIGTPVAIPRPNPPHHRPPFITHPSHYHYTTPYDMPHHTTLSIVYLRQHVDEVGRKDEIEFEIGNWKGFTD